jgi:mannose-1-phosphate guanylyltransferase
VAAAMGAGPDTVDLAGWPLLLLCAGLGTRLRPLSAVRAKPALPVAGTPLVRRLLAGIAAAGVRRVVINLHHRAASITGAVGDGHDLGVDVRYSWEDPVLGSAGGPRRALPLLGGPRALLMNGDTLTDADLGAVAAAHRRLRPLVTLAVAPGDTRRYGGIVADEAGVVRGFAGRRHPEPPPGCRVWHFIGVQAIEAAAFDAVPDGVPYETVRTLYPAILERQPGAIRVHVTDAAFHDIGTPADYLATATRIATAEGRPLDRGARVRVAADAVVEDSLLWDDVDVGAGALLRGCVVADGVRVPPGRAHTRAVLVRADGLTVEPGEYVEDGVLVAPLDRG